MEMRKKFLGEAFWIKKMHLFNETRANIIKEADGSASKAVRTQRSRIVNSPRLVFLLTGPLLQIHYYEGPVVRLNMCEGYLQ